MKPHPLRVLNQTCRVAARLLSDGQERPLSWRERFGLGTHLLLCGRCRRYRRQLLMLGILFSKRRAAQDEPTLPPAARERIGRRLMKPTERMRGDDGPTAGR